MSDDALPPCWVVCTSKSTGKTYWFNTATGASLYTRPTVSAGPPPAKRAREDMLPPSAPAISEDRGTALRVAAAYDGLEDRGRAGRAESRILHLRNFNNWVKAQLISSFAGRSCSRVLDLACGKLGDLQKWKLAGVREYCGIDISKTGLEDAVARLAGADETTKRNIIFKLVRADLGITDLSAAGVFAPHERFDAISCQFAIHYFFQTEARALTFFRNIAGRLAPGGVFVGTTTDADVLIRRLRDVASSASRTSAAASAAANEPVGWSNRFYSVSFPAASVRAQWALGAHPFGVQYRFFLTESVDSIDEYLVPWVLLERLARAAGLEPIANDNFHTFFNRALAAGGAERALLARMGALDCEGTMSAEEWEIAGNYRIFAFRATGTVTDALPPMSVLVPEQERKVPVALSPLAYKTRPAVSDVIDLIDDA